MDLEPEEDLIKVFAYSPDLVSVAGLDGRFKALNQAWVTKCGWTIEDLMSKTFMSLVHPADAERTLAGLMRLAREKMTVAFDVRMVCRDGSFLWFEWSSVVRGELIYSIGRDITHRVETRALLAESEARHRTVLDMALSGIITIDEDGTVESFNRAAEQIFGHLAADVVGHNIKMLMPAPHRGEHDGHLARYRETGERRIIGMGRKVEGLRKDGTRFPLELAVAEVELVGRRVFIGTVTDFSEREAIETELRNAKQEAESANLAKSEFLSRMSHELRTPLHSVIGFAQILEMTLAEPDDMDSVQHIHQAGRHLLALIDEVLDIARIETGELALSFELVEVSLLIGDCVDLVAPQAAARGIELVNRNEQDVHVLGDWQRLQQVLLNLLSNAIKFNRDEGRVEVDVEVLDAEIQISVTDTGPGIPAERLDELFSPFDRLDAVARGIEGSGLGLPLSRGLMEAMGGTLDVDSALGRGTTFFLRLPLNSSEAAADEIATDPAAPPPAGAGGATMLYIDDNPVNIRLMQRLLQERPQISLLTALWGSYGLELAYLHTPDLVLLDGHLPDMSGYEVMQHLGADPRTSNIPVVVVSADISSDQVRRFQNAGIDDYLSKPLSLDRLLVVLDRHFDQDPSDLDC